MVWSLTKMHPRKEAICHWRAGGIVAFALIASTTANAAPLTPCNPPPGWASIASRNTRFVVFGEIHGTEQGPAFVGDVACALAFQGERLLIAIEQDATSNSRLQQVWAVPDNRFGQALAEFWPKGRNDGVGSDAMANLLVRLHHLRAGGRAIDVVAFNGARDDAQVKRFAALPGQGPHEAEQADNIQSADDRRYDHVLVLTGNLHARKEPITDDGVTFEPMAMRLAPAAAVTTVNMMVSGGTMWNCLLRPGIDVAPGKSITPEMIDCGAHATRAGKSDLMRPAYMALGAAPGQKADTGFDGYFWVGKVTASPPAKTQ